MAQRSFGDRPHPLLVGDLSPMARHRPLAQCSMGHKDDGQVDAPRRKHRLYSQTCLECQRNNDAVKMLLKDTIKIKRPISASLLFSRDFKKTAMENNDKRLSYKAAPPEARSAWEKLSEQEKEPYIKEYRRRYVEWKKSSVMAPQLDGTPPQVYTTPGQNPMKEVDCQPDKQQSELLSTGAMIQKTINRLSRKLQDIKFSLWEEVQQHRILRSSDSANERIPSSVLAAAPPEATNEGMTSQDENAPVPCGTLSRLKGIASMRTEAPGVDTKIQKDKMMQNLVKEVDCQPDKQQNELLSSGGIIQKTDRLLNVQQNLEKATNGQQRKRGGELSPRKILARATAGRQRQLAAGRGSNTRVWK